MPALLWGKNPETKPGGGCAAAPLKVDAWLFPVWGGSRVSGRRQSPFESLFVSCCLETSGPVCHSPSQTIKSTQCWLILPGQL